MATLSAKPTRVIGVAAFAAFLATFNETFLNVAFTPIMADFGVTENTVQWLVTAYMLGAAVMVPVTAFLFRRFRTRPLFLFTVSLLILGSAIGALAPSFGVLLAGRIVQAIGTGMLIPVGMNITIEVAPRERLGSYLGLMGAMTTLGPSLSVIVAGGLLAVAHWTTLLWVFGGLAGLCFLSAALLLGDVAELTRPKLDATSVTLIGLALVGILYGISTVFSGQVLTAALAAVLGSVAMVGFVQRQGRIPNPLLDLSTLRIGGFAAGVIMNMISLIIIFAMNILIPIYLQSVRGLPALSSALTLFPAIMLSAVVAPLAGRFYDRHGPRLLLPTGFTLIAVGTALISLTIRDAPLRLTAALFVPVICGSALVIGPVQTFALSHLSHRQNPHGVTVMSTGFQIAGCIGSSLFVGVYYAATAGAGATAPGAGFLPAGLLASVLAVVGLVIALVMARRAPSAPAEQTAASPQVTGDHDLALVH